jgi:predicted AAA+ superfamily ATPase
MIMNNNFKSFKGALYESLFADIISKTGMELFYYGKTREFEIDFVIQKKYPFLIAIKSDNGIGISLDKLMKTHKNIKGVKVTKINKISCNENLHYMPHFYFYF